MSGYRAWVFTIGNEVVHGRVLNTNASYLGRKLVLLGYNLLGSISLVDDVELVARFLRYVLPEADTIITTGGLGPTYDDRTAEAIAKALDLDLVVNSDALEMVRSKYARLNLPLTNERLKMAVLPRGSRAIPNPVGTAPGIHVEVDGKLVIALPGVPREMEAMFEGYVEPLLRARGPGVVLVEREFEVLSLPESTAAEALNVILKRYPTAYVKTQPRGTELGKPILSVYVCASGKSRDHVERLVDELVDELVKSFKERGGVIRA